MEKAELDEKDRKIISIFERNPDVSQAVIAEQVGLSQPTVGARIQKLKQAGAISAAIGMDLKKVGLQLAKVELTTRESINVIDHFKQCPYFLNGMIISGKENLCLFFTAEEISTIESIVDRHLRNNPSVSTVNFGIIISPVNEIVMPVKMVTAKTDTLPCGYNCSDCQYYGHNRCLGCPMTSHYKGKFW
jgi:DNA-binding Lrp family transcriptional regulator